LGGLLPGARHDRRYPAHTSIPTIDLIGESANPLRRTSSCVARESTAGPEVTGIVNAREAATELSLKKLP